MESNYEWEPVIITNSPHGLMVHGYYLGRTLLDHYHDGLTEVEWRRPESFQINGLRISTV